MIPKIVSPLKEEQTSFSSPIGMQIKEPLPNLHLKPFEKYIETLASPKVDYLMESTIIHSSDSGQDESDSFECHEILEDL